MYPVSSPHPTFSPSYTNLLPMAAQLCPLPPAQAWPPAPRFPLLVSSPGQQPQTGRVFLSSQWPVPVASWRPVLPWQPRLSLLLFCLLIPLPCLSEEPHRHTIRHLGSGRAPQSPHSDAFTILLVPFCSQGSLSMLGGGTEGCPRPVLAVPVARLPRVARGLLELLRGVIVSRLASCHILFSGLDKCNLLPLLLV